MFIWEKCELTLTQQNVHTFHRTAQSKISREFSEDILKILIGSVVYGIRYIERDRVLLPGQNLFFVSLKELEKT